MDFLIWSVLLALKIFIGDNALNSIDQRKWNYENNNEQ